MQPLFKLPKRDEWSNFSFLLRIEKNFHCLAGWPTKFQMYNLELNKTIKKIVEWLKLWNPNSHNMHTTAKYVLLYLSSDAPAPQRPIPSTTNYNFKAKATLRLPALIFVHYFQLAVINYISHTLGQQARLKRAKKWYVVAISP